MKTRAKSKDRRSSYASAECDARRSSPIGPDVASPSIEPPAFAPSAERRLSDKPIGAPAFSFAGVPVHADALSRELNANLRSHAFTFRRQIFIDPALLESPSPLRSAVLSHELAHARQSSDALQCYDTPEHVQFGGEPGKQQQLTINGVKLSYGEMISLGDFFASPDDVQKAPPAELQALLDLIRKEVAKPGSVSTAEWQTATHGRYLDLAEKNAAHFSPSNAALVSVSGKSTVDNKSRWTELHEEALRTADAGDVDKAMQINAFADHFLTDAFAAGHLVNKADVMEQFAKKMAADRDPFLDAVAKAAWKNPAVASTVSAYQANKMYMWWDLDSADRFKGFLGAVDSKQPDRVQNLVVKALHDRLNTWFAGVPVENAKGDQWALSGDNTLNAKSLEIGRKAVAASQQDVRNAGQHKVPAKPYDSVWDFVPRPTATPGDSNSGVHIIKGQADIFTDPKNSATINAIASLIADNIALIMSAAAKAAPSEIRLKPAPSAPTTPSPPPSKGP